MRMDNRLKAIERLSEFLSSEIRTLNGEIEKERVEREEIMKQSSEMLKKRLK